MSQPLHAYSAYDLLVDDAHVDDDDAHSTDEEEADTLARAAPQNDLPSTPLGHLLTQAPGIIALASAHAEDVPPEQRWNAKYQYALELPATTAQERADKFTLLTQLSQDFVATAIRYARTIICELSLPEDSPARTIRPVRIGGFAGGRKYIVNGVLFKFAQDASLDPEGTRFLYGGEAPSLERAAKAAGHELRGAIHAFSGLQQLGRSAGIRVPLQALVDYRGFRIMAMPLLPLERLAYGSDDGGTTVHAEPEFHEELRVLADYLHLKEHVVGTANQQLFFGGDVEAHQGSDGRRYLLDLARMMPPESPDAKERYLPKRAHARSSIFFRLLRPELLQRLKRRNNFPALNPDGFSVWGRHDPHFTQHMDAIRTASTLLLDEYIPDFAHWLDSTCQSHNFDEMRDQLALEAHKRGINCRHFGLVRKHTSGANAYSRDLLFIEALKRTLKNLLRNELRATTEHRSESEFLANNVVVPFLNLVTGRSEHAQTFWVDYVRPAVEERFGADALPDSAHRLDDLPVVQDNLPYILHYILHAIGMQLSKECNSDITAASAEELRGFAFSNADVDEGPLRVKYMSIFSFAEGQMLVSQADSMLSAALHEDTEQPSLRKSMSALIDESSPQPNEHGSVVLASASSGDVSSVSRNAAARLMRLSSKRFGDFLFSDPNNFIALRSAARSHFTQLELLGRFADADEQLLKTARRLVEAGSDSLVQFRDEVIRPLLITLRDAWIERLAAPKTRNALLTTGGASTVDALMEATTLNDYCLCSLPSSTPKERVSEIGKLFADCWTRRLASVQVLHDTILSRMPPHHAAVLLAPAANYRIGAGHAQLSIYKFTRQRSHVAVRFHPYSGSILPQWVEYFVDLDRPHKLRRQVLKNLSANPDCRNELMRLLIEATRCRQRTLALMLSELGASIDQVDPRTGQTQLIRAVVANDSALVKTLLECEPKLELEDNEGHTALVKAILYNRLDMVDDLINAGANVSGVVGGAAEENTPLMIAVDRRIALQPVEAEASASSPAPAVDASDATGFTTDAAIPDTAEAFIATSTSRANLTDLRSGDVADPTRSPVDLSDGVSASFEIIQRLVDAAHDLRYLNATNSRQETALMLAVTAFNPEAARFLISRGARIDLHDVEGRSALWRITLSEAALSDEHAEESAEMLRMLIEAQPISQTQLVEEIGRVSGTADSPVVIRELIRLGGGQEFLSAHRQPDGSTLLALFASKGNTRVVHTLLKSAKRHLKERKKKDVNDVAAGPDADEVASMSQIRERAHTVVPASEHAKVQYWVDPNEGTYNHNSLPIHCAAQKGQVDTLREFTTLFGKEMALRADFYGNTCLHYAAKHGHAALVALLLDEFGADVNQRENNERTPLELAATGNHVEVIRTLLGHRADVNALNMDGWTPLAAAVYSHSTEAAHVLVEEGLADPNTETTSEWTPIFIAVMTNQTKMVLFLLENGANPKQADRKGRSLVQVARDKQFDVVAEMIQAALDGRRVTLDVDGEDSTLAPRTSRRASIGSDELSELVGGRVSLASLALACEHNLADTVSELLDLHNANPYVSVGSKPVMSPLLCAVRCRHWDIVKMLVRKYKVKDVVCNEDGHLACMFAAEYGELEIVRLLVEEAATDLQVPSVMGHLPVVAAALADHRDVVEYLLPKTDIEQRISNPDYMDGAIPLMHAVRGCKCTTVPLFVAQYPESVHVTDSTGQTSLHFACRQGGVEKAVVIRDLIEAGSEVNLADADGRTPLMLMLESQRVDEDALATLLAAGADPNCTDKYGRTALAINVQRASGSAAIERLLADTHADPNIATPLGLNALSMALLSRLHDKMALAFLVPAAHTQIDYTATDKYGRSLLHLAVAGGRAMLARKLAAGVEKVNTNLLSHACTTVHGHNLLHYAVALPYHRGLLPGDPVAARFVYRDARGYVVSIEEPGATVVTTMLSMSVPVLADVDPEGVDFVKEPVTVATHPTANVFMCVSGPTFGHGRQATVRVMDLKPPQAARKIVVSDMGESVPCGAMVRVLTELVTTGEHSLMVNAQDVLGNTPLHYAVQRADVDCVRALLDIKTGGVFPASLAKFSLTNKQDLTALQLAKTLEESVEDSAAAARLSEIAELLQAAGAKL